MRKLNIPVYGTVGKHIHAPMWYPDLYLNSSYSERLVNAIAGAAEVVAGGGALPLN